MQLLFQPQFFSLLYYLIIITTCIITVGIIKYDVRLRFETRGGVWMFAGEACLHVKCYSNKSTYLGPSIPSEPPIQYSVSVRKVGRMEEARRLTNGLKLTLLPFW